MTLKPQQHPPSFSKIVEQMGTEQGIRVSIPYEELDAINQERKRARREIRRKLTLSA